MDNSMLCLLHCPHFDTVGGGGQAVEMNIRDVLASLAATQGKDLWGRRL